MTLLKTVSTLDIPALRFGEREAIRMLAKAGFDGCDWSMFTYTRPDGFFNRPDWREEAKVFKKIADENHIPFLQAHAPFPSDVPGDPDATAKIREYLLLSLEACSLVECPYVIIHPVDSFPSAVDPMMREEAYRLNVEFYGSLIPRARELGVRICLETCSATTGATTASSPAASAPPKRWQNASTSFRAGSTPAWTWDMRSWSTTPWTIWRGSWGPV